MGFEWPIAVFGDLVEIVNEKAKAENADFATYISTENMEVNFGGIKPAASLPSSGGVTKFKIGDTLFSNIRTYFKKVWKASYNGHCSNDVLVFRSKNCSVLNPSYLHNLCRWEQFTELSVRTSKGVKMPRGDKDALVQFEFLLPSIKEQIAIAGILSSLDDRITLLRETNTTLEAIAQALFKSWFVDFEPVHAKKVGRTPEGMDEATANLFPDDFEESELGLVPKGWGVEFLGEKVKISYGKNLPTNNLLEFGFPVYGGNGQIGFIDKYLYESRQVLVACRGAASGKFNQTVPKSFVTNNSLVLESDSQSEIPFGYLKGCISSADLVPFVTGSAQPQVTIDNLKNFRLLIPPDKVLKVYENYSSVIEDCIEANSQRINLLSNLRDTLLPRLISGQLRIADAEAARRGD